MLDLNTMAQDIETIFDANDIPEDRRQCVVDERRRELSVGYWPHAGAAKWHFQVSDAKNFIDSIGKEWHIGARFHYYGDVTSLSVEAIQAIWSRMTDEQ